MNFDKCVKVTVYAKDTIDPTFRADVTLWLSHKDLSSMEDVYDKSNQTVQEKRLFVPCTFDQQILDVETVALDVKNVDNEVIVDLIEHSPELGDENVICQLRFMRWRFKDLLNHCNGELGKSGRIE